MKELAILLNALRPEDLPGDDVESWARFNRTVAIGRDIFGKPIGAFAAGLKWLRECVFRLNRGTDRTAGIWLPDCDTVRRIGHYRDQLIASLRRDSVATDVKTERILKNRIDEAVNWSLFRSAHKGLGNIAARFEEELDRLRQEPKYASSVESGDAMWPLVPDDHVSSDGSRIMKSLTTLSQLESHGVSLSNCLGRAYAFRYLHKGRQGTVFIIGVFDAKTDAPRSTAEIAIKLAPERLSYELVVKQHTAKRNSKPSARCVSAVGELLQHCHTPAVRKHLEKGWRLIAESRHSDRRRVRAQIDSMVTAALRNALNEGEYDELLSSAQPITIEHSATQ